MDPVLTVVVVYLLLLVGLAIWSRAESQSLQGYYLAGKKLPYWVVAFSTNATGESGWLLLGLTGMGYAVGAKAYWVVVGEVLGVALSWIYVSRRLKRMSDDADSITVPDVLSARFAEQKNIIRSIAVVIILSMVIVYIAAQMIATGKAVESFTDFGFKEGVFVGAAIIIGYTFVGGYKAVSYTDVLQGVLMLLGLIIVPLAAIIAAGGWGAITANIATQDPALLDFFAFTGDGLAGWIGAISFLAIGLPFLGVPQLLVRYMSCRDDNELKKARWVSIVVMTFFGVGAVTAGIAGRALFPGLEDSETIFPVLSSAFFPPLVTGVLMVIVLSAIMSTADSLLLLASSAVVRDTMQKLLGSQRSDHQLAVIGKFTTLLIGVLGVFLVFQVAEETIFDLVLVAWSGLGCAFGPVVLCLLYYKKTTGWGVAAGMLAGFLTSSIWVVFIKANTYGLYEAIPGFSAGALATLLVSYLTHKPGTEKSAAAM